MGRLVNRVEDGDAFEGCYERVCARVDNCYTADVIRESSGFRMLLYRAHRLLIEKRDFPMHQSLYPLDTIYFFEQRWTSRVSASGRSSERCQIFSRVNGDHWEARERKAESTSSF